MKRALELAARGLGTVSPNPLVGCVIVHDDVIIAEGWHEEFGGHHAEVKAIEAVEDRELIKKSTVYVTLEPCSFYGKTPACTDLLIRVSPARVVVASMDPNPKVSGRGLELLRNAGIPTDLGVLEREAMAMNKRFFIAMRQNKPYVILKWAETSDGFIARNDYSSKWISNAKSRQMVHQWRSEEDAVLVGYNTAKYDNPALTVRDWEGKNPVRIVVDPHLELDRSLKLFDGSVRTFVLNQLEDFVDRNVVGKQLGSENFIKETIAYVYQQQIGSLIVEGGAATLRQFIDGEFWDEVRIFRAPVKFGEGISAPVLSLVAEEELTVLEDRLLIYYNPNSTKFWQKN